MRVIYWTAIPMKYIAFPVYEPSCSFFIHWFHGLIMEDGNWCTTTAGDNTAIYPFMDRSWYRHRNLWVENVFAPGDPSSGPETRTYYFGPIRMFPNIFKIIKGCREQLTHPSQISVSGIRNHLLQESYSTCNWQNNTLSFIAYIDVGCWKKSVSLKATHIN